MYASFFFLTTLLCSFEHKFIWYVFTCANILFVFVNSMSVAPRLQSTTSNCLALFMF